MSACLFAQRSSFNISTAASGLYADRACSYHRKAVSNNCDVAANGNAGCGVQATVPKSYGKSFNAAGGGFYAMERTTTSIKVWFWSRNDPAVPADVKTAGASVDTDKWVSTASEFHISPSVSDSRLCDHCRARWQVAGLKREGLKLNALCSVSCVCGLLISCYIVS